MSRHTKHLPPGWYIDDDQLYSADGYCRCVRFEGKLEHHRVALSLRNYGHDDYAALWDTNAANLVEVLKSISSLAAGGAGELCEDIKRRADNAISFSKS